MLLINLCFIVCRASWGYYRRLIRENFASHKDETEPERVQLMFDTAIRDADWVVAKVRLLSSVGFATSYIDAS